MEKNGLFIRKPMKSEVAEEGQHELKRHLGSFHLTAIGIGAIIGAGIFVISGPAAAEYAGPALVLSFIIAAIVCVFAGLCYAELSSLIPISGGSYSYSYVALGEFPAWIVGWSITAQYLFSASTVGVGWSGYCVSILKDFGISLPAFLSQAPVLYSSATGWYLSGALINLPAMILIGLVGILIAVGIRAASNFNNAMVIIKLTTVAVFVILGLSFIHVENWTPFIPENTGVFGHYGWSGVLRAAGLVFFAYIGFDTVSTLAQESINPQRPAARDFSLACHLHGGLYRDCAGLDGRCQLQNIERPRSYVRRSRCHGRFCLAEIPGQICHFSRPRFGRFGAAPRANAHFLCDQPRRSSASEIFQSQPKDKNPALFDCRHSLGFDDFCGSLSRRRPGRARFDDDALSLRDCLPGRADFALYPSGTKAPLQGAVRPLGSDCRNRRMPLSDVLFADDHLDPARQLAFDRACHLFSLWHPA